MHRKLCVLAFCSLSAASLCAAREPIPALSADPYRSAIAADAATGRTLFEDKADDKGYPASIVKLMDLLIVLEAVEKGSLRLTDQVLVNADASRTGGSQVYLKEGETFSVEDLIYALIIQSANDAAVALAHHMCGNSEAFVALMNQRAEQLGMTSTEFHSVHGLPPATGQKPDISTPRDLAVLARELITRHPDALRYTSTAVRWFRNNTFEMRTHNRLLAAVQGCDGLKTGYFTAGGFSTVVTAQRDGRRVICVVMGSRDRATRDSKATELLARGFLALATPQPHPPPRPAQVQTQATNDTREAASAPKEKKSRGFKVVVGLAIVAAFFAGAWIRTSVRLRRLSRLR